MKLAAFRACAFLLLCLGGVQSIATEQSIYTVDVDAKPFQVRTYPARVEALVQVTGSRDQAVSAGFRLLAKYIFGGNRSHAKIAMTAPVLQTPESVHALPHSGAGATVAPGQAGAGWQVAFIMPAGSALEKLPIPDDTRIRFRAVPPQHLAAVTFSGFWTDENFGAHAKTLQVFLAQRHLRAVSAPIYAFYDPPWTPWFWRTNEVLMITEASSEPP